MPIDPTRAKSVFLAASDLSDAVERAAYLNRECAGDQELRERVEALLHANENQTSHQSQNLSDDGTLTFTDRPLTKRDSHQAEIEQANTIIAGKYTLVEIIGEGGMGSVWRAKQTEPVKRFVAVKLIKTGMDSRQVLARFEAERQALALMDHPNIAKVLDGGLHEHRPYFVMELVKGVPITEYCDANRMTPQQRLELFVPVCNAIQHAHQKGIIHRDIKPSNVLVALYDDKPVVKVIDFGIAKATGAALTEQTIDTGFGGIVGTPQYMSPEQATFNNIDIDTRSDVYALGVLLYELLTGSPPFAQKELEKRGLLEMLRVVREEEPPRPSTKLSTADALPSLSANRGTEPKKLTGLLRNELDWIVMKALDKDRARRYETANGFAADVQRYLAGEAVLAHPPSRSYRIKKFVRRHKGQVIAASLVLFALLAGMAGTTWGLFRAEQQRQIAETAAVAERDAKVDAQDERAKAVNGAAAEKLARDQAVQAADKEKIANAQAQKRLRQIEKANDILGSIFENLDPKEIAKNQRPLQAVLVENLDKAVAQLEGEAIGDPLVVAAMQNKFGLSLRGLGEPEKAIALFEKSLATRQAKLGPDHLDTLLTANNLATAYGDAGKLNLAVPLHEDTLKLMKAKLGLDHLATLHSMNNLAAAYLAAGQMNLALPLFEEALKIRRAKIGPNHPDTITSMGNLATAYQNAGKNSLAMAIYEEEFKLSKASFGPDHPQTLTSMNNLAISYHTAGKLDLAVPLYEEALKIRRAKLGPDHPDTLLSMSNLAPAYLAVGKQDLAVSLYEETLKLMKAKLGPNHPETLLSMSNLAGMYYETGKQAMGLPLMEEVFPLLRANMGSDHPDTLYCMNNLATAYRDVKKWDLALPLFEETLKLRKAKLGPDHPDTFESKYRLTSAFAETGNADKAVALLADIRKGLPKDSPQLAGMLASIGLAFLEQKKWTEAEPILRECLAIREKIQTNSWSTFNTQSSLGGALLGQKKYADAEPLLLKGYSGMKQREKIIPPQGAMRLPESIDRLIELYTATKKPAEVKKYTELRARYPMPNNVAPMPRAKM